MYYIKDLNKKMESSNETLLDYIKRTADDHGLFFDGNKLKEMSDEELTNLMDFYSTL